MLALLFEYAENGRDTAISRVKPNSVIIFYVKTKNFANELHYIQGGFKEGPQHMGVYLTLAYPDYGL
jgi:hypothetical protein